MKKKIYSDKIIWDDFKKGKEYALLHIYKQYVQILFRYAGRFTGDKDLIKDMIQDLFYDLIKSRKNLGDVDNIKYYLIVSFRRKLIQNLQKKPNYADSGVENLPPADDIDTVENKMIIEEESSARRKILEEALKKLTPKQREIIFYRFTCDFSYEQICEIMSLKYDSARKLNFRALKILRRMLSDEDS